MLSTSSEWLQLLAHSGHAANCQPSLIVVGSHADRHCMSLPESGLALVTVGNAVLEELKERFSGQISFHGKLMALDCRRPYSDPFKRFVQSITEVHRKVQQVSCVFAPLISPPACSLLTLCLLLLLLLMLMLLMFCPLWVELAKDVLCFIEGQV